MHFLFSNSSIVEFELYNNPASQEIKRCLKHLQYIDLDFKEWDNPHCQTSPENLLRDYAKKLNIEIIDNQIFDQNFLNHLHEIYEKNYDGSCHWLNFHEQIHRCEDLKKDTRRQLVIDFREKAGPLTRQFNQNWIDYSVTEVNEGDIFTFWSELGKTPYRYWVDNEPDNFNRLCELAKPWLHFRPKFFVALEKINFLENKKINEFNKWWQQHEESWCHHWGIDSDWSIIKQNSAIVLGKVNEYQKINDLLLNSVDVKRVCCQ